MLRLKEIEEQNVDLTEIIRQQQEYITDLEMELAELTDRWKYVKQELNEIKTRKIMEEELAS